MCITVFMPSNDTTRNTFQLIKILQYKYETKGGKKVKPDDSKPIDEYPQKECHCAENGFTEKDLGEACFMDI